MTLPHRPRLARLAMLRRHIIDGNETFVLHDRTRREVIELTNEQHLQLGGCDGTRDVGGVLLHAARCGAYRRASEIEQLLTELTARGLLEDGLEPPGPAQADDEPRRLEPLAGYRLRCNASGACCDSFSSIAFSRAEAVRAIGCAPETLAGVEPTRFFQPLFGASQDHLAVTMVDGRCAFLKEDGRCRLHGVGVEDAKPLGCRVYPRTLVDDGEGIRVSVRLECPCVLDSIGALDDAEPLVADGALAPGTPVTTLPEPVAVTSKLAASRAEWRRFSERVLSSLDQGGGPHAPRSPGDEADGVALLWSLAQNIEAHGLDAVWAPVKPPASALRPHLEALGRRTHARRASAAAWRSPRDRARRHADWLCQASDLLADDIFVEERLGQPANEEAFYVRALVHGHHLALDGRPVAAALRDRAVRILLARAAATCIPSVPEPSARYPITAVEMMMRAQGLEGYDDDLLSGG